MASINSKGEEVKVDVVGYFIDRMEENEEVGVNNIFVALFDEEQGYYYYAPVGQHGHGLDMEYLEECEEISVERYLEISGHLYTPKVYLEQY